MTYLLPVIPSTRTPAKYHIDQSVTFTDGSDRTHQGVIIGVEYFAPDTPPAEDWGEGWHYTIHDHSDDSSSTYHIPEVDVEGEEQPLQCITCPLGWTPPQYGFHQQVRIKGEDGYYWNGIFGKVIGLTYHEGDNACWFYEIKLDPGSPMFDSYGEDTEIQRESCLEPLPVLQEVLCHG